MLSLLNTTFTNTLRQGFTLIGRLLSKLKARSTYFENKAGTKVILQEIDSAGLLEKASIITTPTAYSDGVLHSVKPEQTFGSELVTNGDFGNDTNNWTPNANATLTIDNDKLKVTINGGSGYPSQSITTEIGKTYRITANSFIGTSSRLALYNTGDGQFRNLYEDGSFDFTITAASTSTQLRLYVYGDGSYGLWDNISVKEVTDADFTFTRGSSATRVNEQGLIESVGVDLPKINYLGGSGSWLLEPQRLNLISRSNEFNFWNNLQSKLTVTSNSITSPDGTVNGTKITQAVSSANARLRFQGILTIGTEYTFSVFAKKGNHDKLIMNISGVNTTFTLTDEWVRYEITETAPSNTFVDVGITNAVVDDFIYIYGAQAEEASYATSYIPTSGSAVTRGADSATNAGSSDLISSTEGVLYLEVAALTSINNFESISLSNGGVDERIRFTLNSVENTISVQVTSGGSTVLFRNSTLSDITAFNKVAIKYKQDDYAIWINGVEEYSNITGAVPTLNELTFTSGGDVGNKFTGNVKCVAVFEEALTDAELTALTS